MVRTDNKKHSGSVTDLKAARIKKNLARLTELVNSSPETKARTMDYIMAKSNKELQADYRARAKANKKQLNYFISLEAHNALTTLATDTGKTKLEILERLLLGNSGNNQTELNRLNAMADTCFQCAGWTGDKCSKGLTLTGFVCSGFESLRDELKAAKARVMELLNVDNKIFSFDYSGNKWVIRKQIDNRWHYKKGNAYALAPEFIQQATISNDGGVWYVELDGQKIEMTVMD